MQTSASKLTASIAETQSDRLSSSVRMTGTPPCGAFKNSMSNQVTSMKRVIRESAIPRLLAHPSPLGYNGQLAGEAIDTGGVDWTGLVPESYPSSGLWLVR